MSVAERLAAVRAQVGAACQRAGRDPVEVTIVGVSKTMPVEVVAEAYRAGLRQLGENRIQEAVPKIQALAFPDATWHLIGHLQTNKAKYAARHFAVVQLGRQPARRRGALGRGAQGRPRPRRHAQVNYAGEASKFGFAPGEALDAALAASRLPGLRVVGLMTVAPQVVDIETIRPVFAGMRSSARACGRGCRTRRRGTSRWG